MWVKAFPTALSAVVIEPDRTIHYSSPNDTVNGKQMYHAIIHCIKMQTFLMRKAKNWFGSGYLT